MAERKVEPAFTAKVSDSLRPVVIQHTHQMRTPPPPSFLQRLTPEHVQRLTPEHTHRLTPEHAHLLAQEHLIRYPPPPEFSRLTPEQIQMLLKPDIDMGAAYASQSGKPHAHLSRSPELYLSPASALGQASGGPPHIMRGKPEAMLHLTQTKVSAPPLLRMVPSPQSSLAAESIKHSPERLDRLERQRLNQELVNQRISPLAILDVHNIAPPPAHSSPASQLRSKSPQPHMSSLSLPTYLSQATVPPRRPSPLLPDGQFSTSPHRAHDIQSASAQLALSPAQALPKLMGLLSGNQGLYASPSMSSAGCETASQTVNYQSALLQNYGPNAGASPASLTRISPGSLQKSSKELNLHSSVPFSYKRDEDSSGAMDQRYLPPRIFVESEQQDNKDVLDYSKSNTECLSQSDDHKRSENLSADVMKEKVEDSSEKERDMIEKPEEWVSIQNPFSQRVNILTNFPATTTTYRSTYRSHSVAVHRAKAASITSAAKSLDILRQNLQKVINKEIDAVVQKYVDMYFKPAMENIKLNNGENAVSAEHLSGLCRQVLEEAKKLYSSEQRSCTPVGDVSDTVSDAGTCSSEKKPKKTALSIFNKKRRLSDSDSEASQPLYPYKRKVSKKKGRPPAHVSGRATPMKTAKVTEPLKREGPKWDPERLKADTLFVMGARANKALGLGATRGRLYIKHPEIFKYSGDQEDKQWLYENNHMPATGGKAYMLLVSDIKELAETEEYRGSPGLMMHILQGFSVPEVMLEKMRAQMSAMRTDSGDKVKSRSVTPCSDQGKDRCIGGLFQDSELNDNLSDVGVDELDKTLPFSNIKDSSKSILDAKLEIQPSPANTELDMLSTCTDDQDHEISPLAMTRGFDYSVSPMPGVSPAPSDLLDDGGPLTAPFDFTD